MSEVYHFIVILHGAWVSRYLDAFQSQFDVMIELLSEVKKEQLLLDFGIISTCRTRSRTCKLAKVPRSPETYLVVHIYDGDKQRLDRCLQ